MKSDILLREWENTKTGVFHHLAPTFCLLHDFKNSKSSLAQNFPERLEHFVYVFESNVTHVSNPEGPLF